MAFNKPEAIRTATSRLLALDAMAAPETPLGERNSPFSIAPMILMYHHVSPARPPDAPRDEGWRWWHTPECLQHHIEQLRGRGQHIISLDEYADAAIRGRPPRRGVVLTFDDGWRDNYDFALPVLQSLEAPATFFVTTGHLEGTPPDPRRMTISQLRELESAGMTIGGHTRTHQPLTHIDGEQCDREVVGCRADLETILREAPRWFAYPGGAFNRATADAVRLAGWDGAVCSLGPAPNSRASRYWMFREVPGTDLRSRRDRARLSPLVRRLWSLRIRQRLRTQLRAA